MDPRKHPRPPLVSVAGWLAVGYALVLLTWGMFKLNNDYFETPASQTWPIAALPVVCGFAALAFLNGWNWGRIFYWVLAIGVVAGIRMNNLGLRVLAYGLPLLLFGAMVAGPGAHWFFTKRDYRRRPGYRPTSTSRKTRSGSGNSSTDGCASF